MTREYCKLSRSIFIYSFNNCTPIYFDMVLNELTILISFTDYHNGDSLRTHHYHQYLIVHNKKQKLIYFFSEIIVYEFVTQVTTQFLHPAAPFSLKQFFSKIYFYIKILIYCL